MDIENLRDAIKTLIKQSDKLLTEHSQDEDYEEFESPTCMFHTGQNEAYKEILKIIGEQ